MAKCLDDAGVQWWLDQGSALGTYRDGHFLPWDHDLDAAVFNDDVDSHKADLIRLMRASGVPVIATTRSIRFVPKKLFGSGVEVDLRLYYREGERAVCEFRHPPVVGSVRRKWVRLITFAPSVLNFMLEFLARRSLALAARWSIADSAYRVFDRLSSKVAELRGNMLDRTKFSAEARYFKGLGAVTVQGRSFPIPGNIEEYLEFKYGADWRTPRRDWIYWKEDGALTTLDAHS